jgi:hypothetical protein
MKKQMTKAEARSFERRWHTVNAEEKKQLRRTTIARKLRQLNALLAWGLARTEWKKCGEDGHNSAGPIVARKPPVLPPEITLGALIAWLQSENVLGLIIGTIRSLDVILRFHFAELRVDAAASPHGIAHAVGAWK